MTFRPSRHRRGDVTCFDPYEINHNGNAELLTITKQWLEGSLPPLTQTPLLMIECLNNLQILRLSRHHKPATKHQHRKCRTANNLEALLATLEHAVFFERLQTVPEEVEAIDAIPLRVLLRWLCAGGVLESSSGAVEVDVRDESVDHKNEGQEYSGFEKMFVHDM